MTDEKMPVEDWYENLQRLFYGENRWMHPHIYRAVQQIGILEISKKAERFFKDHPRHQVLLGLLGGASTGRYGYDKTAGGKYFRIALRMERDGKVSIGPHRGRYAYFTLPYR